jgi:hypothetical protein
VHAGLDRKILLKIVEFPIDEIEQAYHLTMFQDDRCRSITKSLLRVSLETHFSCYDRIPIETFLEADKASYCNIIEQIYSGDGSDDLKNIKALMMFVFPKFDYNKIAFVGTVSAVAQVVFTTQLTGWRKEISGQIDWSIFWSERDFLYCYNSNRIQHECDEFIEAIFDGLILKWIESSQGVEQIGVILGVPGYPKVLSAYEDKMIPPSIPQTTYDQLSLSIDPNAFDKKADADLWRKFCTTELSHPDSFLENHYLSFAAAHLFRSFKGVDTSVEVLRQSVKLPETAPMVLNAFIGGIVVTEGVIEFVLKLVRTAFRIQTIELEGKTYSSLEALVEAIRKEVHVSPEEFVSLLKQTKDLMTGDFLASELADLIIGELKPANYCIARGIKTLLIASKRFLHTIDGYLGPFSPEILIDYLYVGIQSKQWLFAYGFFGWRSRNKGFRQFLDSNWEAPDLTGTNFLYDAAMVCELHKNWEQSQNRSVH